MRRRDPDGKAAEKMIGGCRVLSRPASGRAQAADTARQTATTLDGWLRHNIETQPYTSALIAFGIGWLLGRMHRPL